MTSHTAYKQKLLETIGRITAEAQTYIDTGSATQEDRYELLIATRALTRACRTPVDRAIDLILETACPSMAFRVAMEAGWTEVLKNQKKATADELIKKSGGDIQVAVRIMRVLTASDLIQEVGHQEYASTETMMALVAPGMTDLFQHATDSVLQTLVKLPLWMTNTGFKEPDDQGIGPHAYAFGKNLWKRCEAEPRLKEEFDRAMMVSHESRGVPCDAFDFGGRAALLDLKPDEVFLVDIGGGMGHQTRMIKRKFPNIPGRAIVQDLPHVIEHARQQKTESLGQVDGVEFQEHDMFNPQPVIGAAFYFLSAVLHDWLDGPSLVILGHIKKAMKAGYSRLLVADWVLPDTGARLADASLDLWMMADVCGKERTKSEWEHLMTQAGLRIAQIHRGGVMTVLEMEVIESRERVQEPGT